MNKTTYKKVAEHPDRDEIISKLIYSTDPKGISEWLSNKYVLVGEKKFILSEKTLKSFRDNCLDIYVDIKEDFAKTKSALANGTEADLQLSIRANKNYKDLVIKTVADEFDIKQRVKQLCTVVENRLAQIHDIIQQDPDDINTKIDRIQLEYIEALTNLLEKGHKILNDGPDQIIQHNITVQHIDQYVGLFYEIMKEMCAKMDLETSMYFMELFYEKMSKLQEPTSKQIVPVEERMAEVKILNETINKKLNGDASV